MTTEVYTFEVTLTREQVEAMHILLHRGELQSHMLTDAANDDRRLKICNQIIAAERGREVFIRAAVAKGYY